MLYIYNIYNIYIYIYIYIYDYTCVGCVSKDERELEMFGRNNLRE